MSEKTTAGELRQRFIDAAKNAPNDAIRLRDTGAVMTEFSKGFETGAKYLKVQQEKHSPKRYSELIEGVRMNFNLQSIFEPINKAVREFQSHIAKNLQKVEWDRVAAELEAYSALCSHLDAAITDVKVQKSASLLQLSEYIRSEIGKTGIGESQEQFQFLVGRRVAEQIQSQSASNRAKAKNSEARKWVIEQWNAHLLISSNSKNKKTFSARILPEVRSKFNGIRISANTIERDWLPKNKLRKKRSGSTNLDN